MRILQILPELNVGGVETGTVDLARYLTEHGHYSVVVSGGGTLVSDLEKAGTKHYCLPVDKKSLWTMMRSIRKLRDIIRQENIDIVHARSRVPAWIAFWACRRTKAFFLTTCHGYYSKNFFSFVMGWSKLVIVPSEVIGRHMIDDFGVPPENIRHIPRSVDLKRFAASRETGKSDPRHVISIVGRITPLKGHLYFLKAMAKVIRSVPAVRIWIIGDAPPKKEIYKKELEVLAKRLGLTDYIDFLGNRKDVPHLLAKTDVLVLSTITQEAFGRVILEAQAAGVPVVATRVGGVVEIIDHDETGLLVLPKDTDAMAQAVVKVLMDKALSARLVQQARKKLEEKFTLAHMASQTIKVYEEILDSLNILVVKMTAIGDVILISPSLKAIREKYPKARITCLVGTESRKILQNCPYIDDLVVYDSKNRERGWLRTFHFSRKLRKRKFDMVIDFQNNRTSHLLSFLSFAKESFGYHNRKWGFLISNPVENPDHYLGPVEHQFQILKKVGIEFRREEGLELWPSRQDEEYVQDFLDSEWLGNCQNMVGINIAASEKWKTKNWPVEHIARLCDLLAEDNIRVVITGVEQDKAKVRDLLRLTKTKPADFVGKTDILQLAALIAKCRVYVTPDSASLHVAAAMGTPFIALFGPTDSVRHLPPAREFRLIEKKIVCAPCYDPHCRVGTHECLRGISPEEVAKAIHEILALRMKPYTESPGSVVEKK
ncbi:MAG: lipopolysaccharide heptosyltransferase II [Candidatus Omnitrophota bacterium]